MAGEVNLGIANLTDVELIGSGGFSVVYAATHTLFDRRVAVKILTKVVSDSDRRRFERECRVMGRLSSSPNVVTVFHADYTSQGKPYLIMELVDGGTLADRLAVGGPLPWEEAVDAGLAVCRALGHAHREQILHRDIKPENILIDDGVPKLADFGIAQLRDSTGKSSTQVSASWLHTAPETFENERDERSDIYSLASTIYALIVGYAPFWRDGEESLYPLMHRLMNEPVPQVPAHLAPPQLQAFLQRALAKNPADRPQTADEFATSLAEIRGVPVPADPGTPGATQYAPEYEPTQQIGGLLAAGVPTGGEAMGFAGGDRGTPTGVGPASPPSGPAAPRGFSGPLASTAPQIPAGGHNGFGIGPAVQPPEALPTGSPVLSPSQEGPGSTGYGPHPAPVRPKRRTGLLAMVVLLALAVIGAGSVGAYLALAGDETDQPDGEVVAGSDDEVDEAGTDDGTGTGEDALAVVPELVGLTEEEALELLDELGIEADITEEPSDTEDEGIVIAQDPATGTEASSVAVVVSLGPEAVPVPSVVGQAQAEARSELEGLGFTVSLAERVPSETEDEGNVVSQDPPAGTDVAEGAEVELTVSSGPPEAEVPTVPDVVGLTEAAAISQLEAAGITATVGSRQSSGTVAEGRVISQSPSAGAEATDVSLTVSTGGTVTFGTVVFNPATPHTFEVDETLSFSISYTSTYDGDVRIFARPTTGTYGASGSAALGAGSGTHAQSFSLISPGTVTRIRVFAVDASTDDLIAEKFFTVNYTWEEAGPQPPATPSQLSPAAGAEFDIFPRTTTLTWSSVTGAASYSVEVQYDSGSWVALSSGSATGLAGTSHTFDFVGAQAGRWRVWAVGPDGLESPKSPWRQFVHQR